MSQKSLKILTWQLLSFVHSPAVVTYLIHLFPVLPYYHSVARYGPIFLDFHEWLNFRRVGRCWYQHAQNDKWSLMWCHVANTVPRHSRIGPDWKPIQYLCHILVKTDDAYHTYPNNDSFTPLTDNRKVAGMGVRMQSNDKLEVSLFGIWSSFLPHIVVSCLGEVQTPNSDFAHLAIMQIDTT